MSEPKEIIKIKELGTLPKWLLADAFGVSRKKLIEWISNKNLFELGDDWYFTPEQIKKILDCFGYRIDLDPIRKYKQKLRQRRIKRK